MELHTQLMRDSIIRDMSEGVMTIRFGGIITYINQAAEEILGKSVDELVGNSFVASFFEYEENDAFNQMIVDAAYDRQHTHKSIVPYFTGEKTLQLRVTTSFLYDGDEKVGIVVVLSDISELVELRDAVKAMEKIKALNGKLELRNKLLSETFGRFLSDEIVRQLLDTPDGLALGGKKCTLTVMMSDLRGFTAMSEHMDATDLIAMLNHYLGEMTEIIQKYNGTIIEFIGDGILAIFGAPVFSDKHASDAVKAAIEMQSCMDAINEWNENHDFPHMEMGIGINTGEVIVGNIGSTKRTKYGVVGCHVNLCGRVESYTVGGQVLISPRTRAEITEPLIIANEQKVSPKGVPTPIVLTQVTGIGDLSYKTETERPHPLNRPIPVSFSIIEGKHTGFEQYDGKFVGIGKAAAVLLTDKELDEYANIKLDTDGELFAKVVKKQHKGWLIRFTSVPDGFEKWVLDRFQK